MKIQEGFFLISLPFCKVISTEGRNLYFNFIEMKNNYYIYIMANWKNTVIYIGVTNDLLRRLFEHKNKLLDGFTKKYNLDKLVYFETFNDINDDIRIEKELKKWRREKKNNLIESVKSEWKDLSLDFTKSF